MLRLVHLTKRQTTTSATALLSSHFFNQKQFQSGFGSGPSSTPESQQPPRNDNNNNNYNRNKNNNNNNNNNNNWKKPTTVNDGYVPTLSIETRMAMRDDNVIISDIIRVATAMEKGGARGNPPSNSAVSIKHLYTTLQLHVQEALSEKYGGLQKFLSDRKQFFLLIADPNTSTTYVKINELMKNKFIQREMQKNTITDMLGIDRDVYKPKPKEVPIKKRGGSRGSHSSRDNKYQGRGRGGSSRGRGRGPGREKEGRRPLPLRQKKWSDTYRKGSMDMNATFGVS